MSTVIIKRYCQTPIGSYDPGSYEPTT